MCCQGLLCLWTRVAYDRSKPTHVAMRPLQSVDGRRCHIKMNLFLTLSFLYLDFLSAIGAATYYVKGDNSNCNNCCRGPSGPQGVPGLPGLHGARGMDGVQGSKGDRGDVGSQGLQGIPGVPGEDGPKGHRGRKGVKGECGPQGPQGPKGDLGLQGLTGVKGHQGHKGEKGSPPPKIAFTVTRSEPLGPVMQKTPVTFDKIHTNMGDSFDIYSSHFICKLNGTYLFTVHALSAENRTAYGWIMLNNDHTVAFHGDAASRHGTGSNTIILHLTRDDHVWIQLNENSNLLNHFSTFSGYILFED